MDRAHRPSLGDETVRALNGYYGRLGRIGLDLVRAMLPVERLRDILPGRPLEAASATGTVPQAPAEARSPVASPTLLIEARGDRPGVGVFLVENLTARPVSAPIRASPFVDEQGRPVQPRLVFRPATVNLGPGEHAIVRLAASLGEELEPGVPYRGELSIPALSDRRISVVLRRRPAGAAEAGAREDAPAAPAATAARPAASSRTSGGSVARARGAVATRRRPRATSSDDTPG